MRMKNPKAWTTRVWQNAGEWHTEIRGRFLSIMCDDEKVFRTFMTEDEKWVGTGSMHFSIRDPQLPPFACPQLAAEYQLKVAKKFAAAVAAAISATSKEVKG